MKKQDRQGKKTIPPGKGERIALAGYQRQTEYQIWLVLDKLLKDELIEVEFASLESGIGDDLILATKRGFEYYQFRRRAKGSLTFSTCARMSTL